MLLSSGFGLEHLDRLDLGLEGCGSVLVLTTVVLVLRYAVLSLS